MYTREAQKQYGARKCIPLIIRVVWWFTFSDRKVEGMCIAGRVWLPPDASRGGHTTSTSGVG